MKTSLATDDLQKVAGRRGFLIYLTVALAAGLSLSLYYVAKSKAFAFYDVGSDTLDSFYPMQVAVARQLKHLQTITWSFDLGLGGFIGSLFDPLWLVTGWLPDSTQLALRLPMFVLRLVLAGGFFYAYLRQIGFLVAVAIVGGLGYAFSSYGLINAQWEVVHGTEFVQFAAYLFLFERYLHGRRRWFAIAAGAVVGLGHPLGLYMFALFSVAYGAVRLLAADAGSRRDLAVGILTFSIWCLPGLAITAPLLFPAVYYLLESPRAFGEHSILHDIASKLAEINNSQMIGWEIGGLLGKDLAGSAAHYAGWINYFEGPGFYMGLLPLLAVPQLLSPRATRRERLLLLIGLGGCALYFVWPALRYVVYGFGHIMFRFSSLWISSLLLVLGLSGLQRALVNGWWRPGVLIGGAAILAIVFGTAILTPATVNLEHGVRIIGFVAVYAALCLLTTTAGGKPWSIAWIFVAICACELLTFAVPPVIGRNAVSADGSSPAGRYDDDTVKALAYIRQHDPDAGFHRIEKTYSSIFEDDALVQDYAGTASYYFHATSVTRFVDRMQLARASPYPNYISPMTPRRLVLDLLGVRYVLTRQRSLDGATGMTYVAAAGDVDIYRNDSARAFATFYDSIAAEGQADALPAEQRDGFLLANAVVEDAAAVEASLSALRAGGAPASPMRSTYIQKRRDDQLYGEVQTPAASLLLLSMPFDHGWSAWMDGKPLALFRADYGLTAALLPAGKHVLELVYAPPGRSIGWAALAGALAFLIVYELFPRWRSQRRASARQDRLNVQPGARNPSSQEA